VKDTNISMVSWTPSALGALGEARADFHWEDTLQRSSAKSPGSHTDCINYRSCLYHGIRAPAI